MRALIYGAGAREHALAARLSAEGWTVSVAPGNAGIARSLTCTPIDLTNVAACVELARSSKLDLAIVGPEAPLIAGLADALRASGIVTFGPSQAAARIEGSKAFSKELMMVVRVPTAAYAVFEGAQGGQLEAARHFARSLDHRVAIKADGIAGGKGVVIATSAAQVEGALQALMVQHAFGEASRRVVVEELLEGPEVSLMALCDGRRAVPLPPVHDYKRVLDDDLGPNTGGMGSVAPTPRVSGPGAAEALCDLSIRPVIEELARRGTPFSGLLYAGLMLTSDGPKVLEYNCRFGDPETQSLLWSLDGRLGEALFSVARGELATLDDRSLRPSGQTAVCVVVAAQGYPEAPRSGDRIDGLEAAEELCDAVYCAGVAGAGSRGRGLVTSGGRVLSLVGVAAELPTARERAYAGLQSLRFEGLQVRKDIGSDVPRDIGFAP
jgi:phosphoribosylamine--glycine ligase